MKTLVAQLWDDPEVIGTYRGESSEVNSFWKPCMATVKSWAVKNGWDYKRYNLSELEPLLPDLSSVEHVMKSKWNQACIAKIGILNNSAYDKIIVMDADIYVYGNPQLGNATFGVWTEGRWFPNDEFPVLAYPQGGLYYSTCGPDVYQWCYDQFVNPCREFQFIKLCNELTTYKYLFGECGFGEQAILCAYINNHEHENIDNHYKWKEITFIEPNSFLHFDSTLKSQQLQELKYKIQHENISSTIMGRSKSSR